MKIAFQMDYFQDLNIKSDSTIAFMEAFLRQKWEVFFYHPKSLSLLNNKLKCNMFQLQEINHLNDINGIWAMPSNTIQPEDMDIIMIRQDPPFDMGYITSTFLLEKIMHKVKIINNPVSIRNSPEKLLVTNFHNLMPKTLISSNIMEINNFVNEYQQCVIKPLYGNAGSDVFYLYKNDKNLQSIIQYFLHSFNEQIIVQEFLPNVSKVDKRIILVNGEPMAFINRVPPQNAIKSNLAAGGTAESTQLTERDVFICNTIKETLKNLELFFVGIDVIDGYLTEINVTSPTGLRAWQQLTNKNLADDIVPIVHKLHINS